MKGQHAQRSQICSVDWQLSGMQVIWRLDSGAKTFLPRLQGALTAINPLAQRRCLLCCDTGRQHHPIGGSQPPIPAWPVPRFPSGERDLPSMQILHC